MQKPTRAAQILMIEDNLADVAILRYGLDQHKVPYELNVLSDGEKAMTFVQQERRDRMGIPCVIVLDLKLPKHCGLDVLRSIRKTPPLSHVAVIVLTTFGSPDEAGQAADLGARLYRNKPSELDDWIVVAGQILAICQGLPALPGAFNNA